MNGDSSKSMMKLKRFFKIKKQEKLVYSKETFIFTFTDTNLFTEFREFADDDDATNFLKFCENYTRLEQLVSEHVYERSSKPTETFQSMARFMASDSSQLEVQKLDLPVWLVPHFLIFYATFLSSGCPCPVVISQESRLSILSQLEAGSLHKINSNIFDDAADEVLNSLYKNWYPRYGDDMPLLDPSLIPVVNAIVMSRDLSTSSSSTESTRRKSMKHRKRSVTSIKGDSGYRNPIDLVLSKDCFVRILYDQLLCKEFDDFIEADHCKENLIFFDSYIKLENLLIEHVPNYGKTKNQVPVSKAHPNSKMYGRFVSHFLQLENFSNANLLTVSSIPPSIYSHLILFYATFIAPGSLHEVNITDKLRRKIAISLANSEGSVDSSIFEGAANEVMDLMYLNTFKKFVVERKQQP